ncbi:MAG: hypothetical protein ABSG99_02810 [Sedimentisphaerales bacterium]
MKTKRRAKKVWRIFRFRQRFELPDNIRFDRQKPLIYIRYYVGSGQDDESINFKRQIAACKASQRRHILLAVFMDLLEIAANYSRAFRGYILDEHFEPAGIIKIAGWVGLEVKEAGKIFRELEQIGLIERILMPEFDLSVNDNKGGKKGRKQKSRARTRKSEKKRAPLKNKGKSEIGNGNSSKVNKKTGKEPERNKRQANSKKQATGAATGKGQDQINHNPTTNPKVSDAQVGGSNERPRTCPPGKSITQQYKQTEQIGAVLQKLYNPEAEEFAQAVYKAIGTPYARDSKEGRSELACFKMAWVKAQIAGLAPRYLTALWDRTIREAETLKIKRHRKPKSYWRKSPEAVLRKLFDRFLNNAKRDAELAEPKRAISIG